MDTSRLLAWWETVTWYRRMLLMAQLAMILVFAIALAIVYSRPGFVYQDALLRPSQAGDSIVYAGRLDREQAAFTVSPGGRVSFTWGEYDYGPYEIVEDPAAVPEGYGWTRGIEIREGEQVLFRGGYTGDPYAPLYREDGSILMGLDTYITINDGGTEWACSTDGELLTEEGLHAPGPAVLARLVLDPELHRQGSVWIFLLVTMMTGINMYRISFPMKVFRRNLRYTIQNWETAEPSDSYQFLVHASWLILAVLECVLYWRAVFSIYY